MPHLPSQPCPPWASCFLSQNRRILTTFPPLWQCRSRPSCDKCHILAAPCKSVYILIVPILGHAVEAGLSFWQAGSASPHVCSPEVACLQCRPAPTTCYRPQCA